MNKPNIQLTYHANYNGWDMSIDGDYDHEDVAELTGQMVDLTVDSCDDDGEYFYSGGLTTDHHAAAIDIVQAKYPNADIDFEFDTFSS